MKALALVLLILCGTMFAEWIDFGIDGIDHATISVVESTPTGMILDITIPGISIIPSAVNDVNFSNLSIPGATITALEPGYPQFPKVSFLAAVPSEPSITCTVESIKTISLGQIIPFPMQPILPENATESAPFTYIPSAYETGTYPSEIVQYNVDGILRGVTIGRFVVNPVSWDAETGELAVCLELRIRIEFGGSVTVDSRLYSRFFEPTFNRSLINADILGEPDRSLYVHTNGPIYARTPEEAFDIDGADLLIMAGDDFVETMIEDFVTAKFEQGYLPAVVSAGTWTYTEIADYIQNAYDSWELPPSFILTIGDGPELTAYYAPTGIWSDNRYACVDGSDYMADIFHGRFATPTEYYPNVQEKQLKWQFDPVLDPDFWNNVLTAGALETGGDNTANRWFLFTCEAVHDTYEDIFDKTVHRMYLKDTSLPPPYYYHPSLPSAGQEIPAEITYDGSTSGIIDVINSGVFMIQHRSHGSVSGWVTPSFQISDFSSLTNGDNTPAVFSFNCSTGKFFNATCFAECLTRMAGGAVMVVAACGTSYSYFNDYVIYGCHASFNDDFVSPPFSYTNPSGGYLAGQMMTDGKLEMQVSAPFNPYGAWESYAEDTWDLFLVFGDPTMDMRTMVPVPLTVNAPLELPEGSTEAVFIVSTPDKGATEGALVCLRKEDESLYATGLTDSDGQVILSFDPLGFATQLDWTVTAHNALPEKGAINGTGIEDQTGSVEISVGTPFPNPSAGMIFFPVSLEAAENFELAIFDLSGRAVETVLSGELSAGTHEILWNGHFGETAAPPGVYLARYVTGNGNTGTIK
ncbi:MAG: T9SS type A sorting domain-containing protein, partial [Candidatus Fermentibacteraceae bacterium]|nr:T9SS type A sorting domain-containing protein [Candidatus Fermentibacteraceae bacterium]